MKICCTAQYPGRGKHIVAAIGIATGGASAVAVTHIGARKESSFGICSIRPVRSTIFANVATPALLIGRMKTLGRRMQMMEIVRRLGRCRGILTTVRCGDAAVMEARKMF